MEYSNERQYIAEQEALKEQGEQQYNDELYAKEMRTKSTDWQIPIDGKLVGKKRPNNRLAFLCKPPNTQGRHKLSLVRKQVCR